MKTPITPAEAGLSLKIVSGPTAGVDISRGEDRKENAWPHIAYSVELWDGAKYIFTTPYKLGIGHVKRPAVFRSSQFTSDEQRVLNHWNANWNTDGKRIQAAVAAKLAKSQKVAPTLDDVAASLLLDGSAHFDSQSFEDWCANYGYDTDSRSAEDFFRTCDNIGRALSRALGREKIDSLREWASNH